MLPNPPSGHDVTNPAAADPRQDSYHLPAATVENEQSSEGAAQLADSGFDFTPGHYMGPHGFQDASSMGSCSSDGHDSHPEGSQSSSTTTIPDSDFGEQGVSQSFSEDADLMLLQPAKVKKGLTAGSVAKRFYRNVNINSIRIDSTVSKRIATLAAKRRPEPRDLSHKPNLQRRGNVEAMLAQIAGQETPRACKSCRKGHGPWTECVVLDGNLCGSCANCWYNACGSRCTFHDSKVKYEPGPYHHLPPPPPPTQATAGPSAAPTTLSYQPPPTPAPQAGATGPQQPSAYPTYIVPQIMSSFGQWGLSGSTAQMVAQSSVLDTRERSVARLENAAKELGMRIAEHAEQYGDQPGSLPSLATMAMASG